MAESYDEVCNNIRACLSSVRGFISISDLNRDYKSLLGTAIPYKEHGAASLEAFIRKIPTLKIISRGNEILVDAKPTEKSMHLTNLMDGQKSAKKKNKTLSKHGGSLYRRPNTSWGAHPPARRSVPQLNSNYYRTQAGSNYADRNRNRNANGHDQRWSSDGWNRPENGNHNSWHGDRVQENRRNPGNDVKRPGADGRYAGPRAGDEPIEQRSAVVSQMRRDGPSPKPLPDQNHRVTSSRTDVLTPETLPIENIRITIGNGMRDNKTREVAVNAGLIKGPTSQNENRRPSILTPSNSFSHAELDPPGGVVCELNNLHSPQSFIPHEYPLMNFTPTPVIPLVYNGTSPSHQFSNLIQPVQPPTNIEINAKMAAKPRGLEPAATHTKTTSDKEGYQALPYATPNFTANNHSALLRVLATQQGLPVPVYTTLGKNISKKNASFICKIKVGDRTYSSYPEEVTRAEDAHEIAAKIAYNDLKTTYLQPHSQSLKVTTDGSTIISRVAKIVDPHKSGLKSDVVERDYVLQHKETLPSNWLDIIKQLSLLSVDKLLTGFYVYPPQNTAVQPSIKSLPQLILPESSNWNVFITCVVSTNEVYFRLLGENYTDKYEKMSQDMERFYTSGSVKPAPKVEPKCYYAAIVEGGLWFRVESVEVAEDGIKCFLIDHGDYDRLPADKFYPLHKQFTTLAAQAARCSLSGLEKHKGNEIVSKVLSSTILGKPLVGKVDSRNPLLSLTLFDTSCEDVDLNINTFMAEKISIELVEPVIPKLNCSTEANLISVHSEGLAFVVIVSPTYKLLRSLLTKANQELAKDVEPYRAKTLDTNAIYLAKSASDGEWHRAMILNINEDQIEMNFVDFACPEIVSISDIAEIHQFSDALETIPFQAMQVMLEKPNNNKLSDMAIEMILHLSIEDGSLTTYLMKTTEEGEIPKVELFKRDSGKLYSLNKILGHYFLEYRGEGFKEEIELSAKGCGCSWCKWIKQCTRHEIEIGMIEKMNPMKHFPVPNDPFMVFVSVVANPFNFVVQPLSSRKELNLLMEKMQDYYEENKMLITIQNLKPGDMMAVKYENKWYRASLLLNLSDQSRLSVKLIDYGKIVNVSYDDISHLMLCFRELPIQAAVAGLAGIEPTHGDWNMDDCFRFVEMASEKELLCVYVNVTAEKISVLLFDGEIDTERDLGAELIKEYRATDITQFSLYKA